MPKLDAALATDRMRTTFDLFEVAVAIQRQNLRRRFPEADSARIDRLLQQWLLKEDSIVSPPAYARRKGSG